MTMETVGTLLPAGAATGNIRLLRPRPFVDPLNGSACKLEGDLASWRQNDQIERSEPNRGGKGYQ